MVIPNAPNWVKELNHCAIAVEIIIVDLRFDTVEISLGKEYPLGRAYLYRCS